jgi:hypothetical protein
MKDTDIGELQYLTDMKCCPTKTSLYFNNGMAPASWSKKTRHFSIAGYNLVIKNPWLSFEENI